MMMNVSWNLKVVGWKKNHNFLLHYNQVGGRRNQQLPINVLRHGSIFYYLINFHQHKNFYDFYDEKIVDDFLNSIYERFVSVDYYKIQGYGKIINYQQTELVNLENARVWLTNVYNHELNFKNIMSGWYFFQPTKNMDFTDTKAVEENYQLLVFSDHEEGKDLWWAWWLHWW